MKQFLYISFIFLGTILIRSQNDRLQYGGTIKLTVSCLPKTGKSEPKFIYRISASAGIADFWMKNIFYPSVNGELQLYNGGIGSTNNEVFGKPNLDFILAFTLTSGYNIGNLENKSFLRYFSDFATPSLKNPYLNSVSLGTNLIFTSDKNRVTQRVGFLNLNSNDIQISYYNDGTPFGFLFLGDGEDRYYTGGGTLSYDKFNNNTKNAYSLELSFHKFTGFNKSSFDFGNETSASLVEYGKDTIQEEYNKSVLRLNTMFFNKNNVNFGAVFSIYNHNLFDVQHLIHNKLSYSFHRVSKPFFFTVEPQMLIKK